MPISFYRFIEWKINFDIFWLYSCLSNTQNSETLPNSASISGLLKKVTLTTIFYGASFYQDRPTTEQTKDATSASKKNYSFFADLNYHHSVNVMSSCSHAGTETKRCCVTIEVLFLCKFIEYTNDGTNILNYKIPWWVSNHETGL